MKKLEANPPWRKQENSKEKKYEHAKLKGTNEPGQNPTMYVPKPSSRKPKPPSSKSSKNIDNLQLDSELRYTFQRNFQFLRKVFSPELLLLPLPEPLGHSIRRNLGFFTRVFTQFWEWLDCTSHLRVGILTCQDCEKQDDVRSQEARDYSSRLCYKIAGCTVVLFVVYNLMSMDLSRVDCDDFCDRTL